MIGIKDGAVLQRGADNSCNIMVYGISDARSSYGTDARNVYGTVTRCKYGTDHPDIDANVIEISEDAVCITGIPVGGPYCVSLDGMIYKDIYVGDVWLLAGQSNMEGNGVYRPGDTQPVSDAIRAYCLDGKWKAAAHPTHLPTETRDNIHRRDTEEARKEWQYKGVGPGIAFAGKMHELTGVPQGIVCCAKGGSRLEEWSPDRRDEAGDSLYGSLLLSLKDTGHRVAGLFWSQGCSEGMSGNKDIAGYFTNATEDVFSAIRKDVGAQIPIVQMQLCRLYGLDPDAVGESFTAVREAQRTLDEHVDKILTVPTVHLQLDDIVHLSADSQDVLGTQAAEAMYLLAFGERTGLLPPIKYASYHMTADKNTGNAIITVKYKNVYGGLKADVRPMGFTVSDEALKVKNNRIFHAEVMDDSVVLRVAATCEQIKGLFLGYGCGAAPDCNVTDAAGRSIPAMAGIWLG